jgi:hypothetical protein
MNKLQRRIVSVGATAALLLNTLTPAFAATTIEISGNGSGSDNWTTVNQSTTTSVTQNNTANVTNTVDADAKTGGNDAGWNTGGDVVISTGNAEVKANIENVLNSNAAEVDCCATGATDVKISGNGAYSDNGVKLDQTTVTAVAQANNASVTNDVDADAKTGGNDADFNTGGDVTLVTGNAKVDADVSTTANVNVAHVGSSVGASNPSASFVITGNGAGSDNYITAALAKVTSVSQTNSAKVNNDVDADAKTGGNDAGFNTGGDVVIGTGDAKVYADIENALNFNYADVDCGCTWDVLAKIAGNGAEPCDDRCGNEGIDGNIISLGLNSVQAVGQGNVAGLTNDLTDLDAFTGYNDVELNTSEVDGDPAIVTGDALVDTGIVNSGNVNSVGDLMDFDMPEMPNFEWSFNMAALWAFFGMHV